MRILCLGIGYTNSPRYEYQGINAIPYPTIFDYDLVIMDLDRLVEGYFYYFQEKKDEFRKFFQSKGVCFVLSANKETYTSETVETIKTMLNEKYEVSNYGWCPFSNEIRIVNKPGETMMCQYNDAKPLFDSINFRWKCFFSKYPEQSIVLARNRANDAVSIMVPYENGYCIFLPMTDDKDKNRLVDLLIKSGLNIIPEKEEEIVTEFPPWATEYMTETELNLLSTRNKINEKLGRYNRFKPLLWETGPNLQKLVESAFAEIGIEITELPKESHGDFEFPLSENVTGVCEVKGLEGSADRRSLRQLLDYYMEQRDIEQRKVKGIFIVNHFRNQKPSKRGDPATLEGIDLAKKHNFHIMTTVRLYDVLSKFWENKITKEDFLKEFLK